MRRLLFAGMFVVGPLLAQSGSVDPDANTLTITASRTSNVQPDLVVIAVQVDAPQGATPADAVAVLAGTGITAANFSNVYGDGQDLSYGFTVAVPFAKMKDTVAALIAAQKKGSAFSVQYAVSGAQVSPELQAAQGCSYPALIADANAQARTVAAAAGVTVREIIGMSDGGLGGVGQPAAFSAWFGTAIPVARVGYFSVSGLAGILSVPAPTIPTTCSIMVQYRTSR